MHYIAIVLDEQLRSVLGVTMVVTGTDSVSIGVRSLLTDDQFDHSNGVRTHLTELASVFRRAHR